MRTRTYNKLFLYSSVLIEKLTATNPVKKFHFFMESILDHKLFYFEWYPRNEHSWRYSGTFINIISSVLVNKGGYQALNQRLSCSSTQMELSPLPHLKTCNDVEHLNITGVKIRHNLVAWARYLMYMSFREMKRKYLKSVLWCEETSRSHDNRTKHGPLETIICSPLCCHSEYAIYMG
jgi:hypothetical protein